VRQSCVPPPNGFCGYHHPIIGVLDVLAFPYAVLAYPFGNGWFDDNNGGKEIGDFCNSPGNVTTLGGFQVQGIWSNRAAKCIVSPGPFHIGSQINVADSTSATTSTCVFNGQLFAFWKANDPSNRIFVAQSTDGRTWSGGQPINGSDSTSDSVAVCAFNGYIYVFWKANDSSNRIYFSRSSSGAANSWPPGQVINGSDSTSAAPGVCVSPGEIFLCWKANDPSNQIYFSSSSSGVANSWPPGQVINDSDSTSAAPAVCYFSGQPLCSGRLMIQAIRSTFPARFPEQRIAGRPAKSLMVQTAPRLRRPYVCISVSLSCSGRLMIQAIGFSSRSPQRPFRIVGRPAKSSTTSTALQLHSQQLSFKARFIYCGKLTIPAIGSMLAQGNRLLFRERYVNHMRWNYSSFIRHNITMFH